MVEVRLASCSFWRGPYSSSFVLCVMKALLSYEALSKILHLEPFMSQSSYDWTISSCIAYIWLGCSQRLETLMRQPSQGGGLVSAS